MITNLGIKHNKIRDDATNTSLYTNNYDGQEVLFERARNMPKEVAKFQKETYEERPQQDIKTLSPLSPLITLPKDKIFMFNIVINKQPNNTYMGESKLSKNAQDFIVLLEHICTINKNYNLYKNQEPEPILIDLTIKNNDGTKKKQLKIELMDATKDREEINKIKN